MFFEHKVAPGFRKSPQNPECFSKTSRPSLDSNMMMILQMLTPLDVSESKPGTEKF